MEQLVLTDLLPETWRHQDGKFYIMQATFQCLFYSPSQHKAPYVTGFIDDVLYLIIDLPDGISYQDYVLEFSTAADAPVMTAAVSQKATPSGVHLLLFTPYTPGQANAELEARSRLECSAGLINALEGKNAAYLRRFVHSLSFPDGITTFQSPSILNPATFPQPFSDLNRLPSVAAQFKTVDPSLKTRLALALRWFDKANRENDPLDAFLKAWFALEVLGMPDDANVRPLTTMLAQIYGKTNDEARDCFQLGRVQGLRSKVIHEGLVASIHYRLQDYVQAVFVDILMHLTGHPSEKRAGTVLANTEIPQSEWRP